MSREISQYRKEIEPLKHENAQIPEYKTTIQNLLREKATVNSKFSNLTHGTTVNSGTNDEISRLKLALSHQKTVESRLCQELVTLRASAGHHELSCKKIISVCCNVPLSKIEKSAARLLESLRDEGSNDFELISTFIAQIKDENASISPVGVSKRSAPTRGGF
jgi:predicted RNase H-like nuclease (RuvC/YqgF family)